MHAHCSAPGSKEQAPRNTCWTMGSSVGLREVLHDSRSGWDHSFSSSCFFMPWCSWENLDGSGSAACSGEHRRLLPAGLHAASGTRLSRMFTTSWLLFTNFLAPILLSQPGVEAGNRGCMFQPVKGSNIFPISLVAHFIKSV